MNWEPNEKELKSVIALPARRRYEYTAKLVADHQVIWSLKKDSGWCLLGDSADHEFVPVWPHPKFVLEFTGGSVSQGVPAEITLEAWKTRWTPGMQKDGRQVAVFPTSKDKAVCVPPAEFLAALQEELDQIE